MKWHRRAVSLIKGWCPKIEKRRNILFFDLDRFHKTEGTNFFLIGLVFSLILIAGTYLLAKRAEEIGPFYFTLRLSEGHYDPKQGLYIIKTPEYYLDIGIYQESIEINAPPNARVLISAYWTSGPGFTKRDCMEDFCTYSRKGDLSALVALVLSPMFIAQIT